MNLPKQDSATGRGIKTAVQAMIGFIIGLGFAVWGVPGVPEAVLDYVQKNWLQVALTIGIPSGLTSFVWNVVFRKNVPNY